MQKDDPEMTANDVLEFVQLLHQNHALRAWAEIEGGRPNPLVEWLAEDERLRVYLAPEDIRVALETRDYVGDAPERALALARRIREREGGMRNDKELGCGCPQAKCSAASD